MACDAALTGSPNCNGQGRCMSMSELAKWANNNGDATAFTYGKDPNNPLTCDGGKIFGCLCDKGFTGYDCSLRVCPAGDDPGTYDDHNEVQLLQCSATDGYFSLTFRQQQTPPIFPNTTALELKHLLESLTSLSKLSVYFSKDGPPPPNTLNLIFPRHASPRGAPAWGGFVNGLFTEVSQPSASPISAPSTVCNTDLLQVVIISFDTTHGPLPPLTASTTQLIDFTNGVGNSRSGKVNVYSGGRSVLGISSVTGTTETASCNNRGKCDHSSGICSCFSGWSSSDGEGNKGFLGDCGYRNGFILGGDGN